MFAMDRDTFIKEIHRLCDGENRPDHTLLDEGMLPDGWKEEYLSLLKNNRIYWQNLDSWPRNLFYSFYRVALHHKYSYDEWAKKNGANQQTEVEMGKIRLLTEAFIYGTPNDKW